MKAQQTIPLDKNSIPTENILHSIKARLAEASKQLREGKTVNAYEMLRQAEEFVQYELSKSRVS